MQAELKYQLRVSAYLGPTLHYSDVLVISPTLEELVITGSSMILGRRDIAADVISATLFTISWSAPASVDAIIGLEEAFSVC